MESEIYSMNSNIQLYDPKAFHINKAACKILLEDVLDDEQYKYITLNSG